MRPVVYARYPSCGYLDLKHTYSLPIGRARKLRFIHWMSERGCVIGKACDNGVLPGHLHSISTLSTSPEASTIGLESYNGRSCKEETFESSVQRFTTFYEEQDVS